MFAQTAYFEAFRAFQPIRKKDEERDAANGEVHSGAFRLLQDLPGSLELSAALHAVASHDMRICILNPGIAHGALRTQALVGHFDEIHYLELRPTPAVHLATRPGLTTYPEFSRPMRGKGVKIMRWIDRLNPDGVVCHFASGPHFFDQAFYGSRPLAVVAMGQDVLQQWSDRRVNALYGWLTRLALGRVDYLCCKSRHLLRQIELPATGSARTDVNYWGLDTGKFIPGDRLRARKKLGIPNDVRLVLSPRAIIPRCNIERIVEAFADVRRHFEDAHLVVVGRSEKGYLQRVRHRIRALGLEDAVSIHDRVPQEVLIDFYHASDIVVSVASSDGFPTTVLEAMACRRPVVAGRIPQVEELVMDGHNGLLCDFDRKSLRQAFLRLFADPTLADSLVDQGTRTVERVGDLDSNAARFAEDFTEVISTHRGQRGTRASLGAKALYLTYFLANQLQRQ